MSGKKCPTISRKCLAISFKKLLLVILEVKMRTKGLWYELLAEFFGTFVLILLGDGVVANVGLALVWLHQVTVGILLLLGGHLQ